nr:MAG TPA: hypothetical protein [Caudoviricetes sp.]
MTGLVQLYQNLVTGDTYLTVSKHTLGGYIGVPRTGIWVTGVTV